MRAALAASLLLGLAGVSGCVREAEKPAGTKGVAEAQSRLAASPEQSRLWQKAASTGAAGLEKAPVVGNPVVPRPRVSFQDRKAPEPEVRAQFAASATGVRILSVPDLPDRAFEGAAKVLQAEGDRLVLDFGNQRVLNLQIRVGGSPLRAAAGAFAQVDLRVRGLQARREIIAIRLAENDGNLSVRENGREPIAVKVPLFQLIARQVGKPEAGTMPVEIRVGSESKVLAQGQRAEFSDGGLTVLLESSTAITGAAAAADAEGPPFAMRLMAWPTR